MRKNFIAVFMITVLVVTQISIGLVHPVDGSVVYAQSGSDWPQLQHDPQRTGYTPDEVRPPYVYLWKWNQVPFASRTQPVVADGRLFIGGLDGLMYARNARTGAPLWTFATAGPIRHSAAVYEGKLFFGSYDGKIYALDAASGDLRWQFQTGGGIATAPVVDEDTAYIGSTDGVFYALDTNTGGRRWSHDVGAPILTSPALSADGDTVHFGAENITAYALDASDGKLRWSTRLRGQSLADRWPVVVGGSVIYRSQPLRFFHDLLREGDDVMDQAGAVNSSWTTDWNKVRPYIVSFLAANPDRQTFFALDAATGSLRGPAPVLYTYGNQDNPGPPAVRGKEIYTLYRARHGIQQDAGSVHVTTRYDATLGRMDVDTLNLENLTLAPGQRWSLEYRATSDEPAMLSMAGSMLFVDNWTRLGGIDVDTGQLFEVANVADHWPECWTECVGRAGPLPFFESYPFPGPRVGEGRTHRPPVIASGVIYWRLIEGGLAAIGHASGAQSQTYTWPEPDQVPGQPASDLEQIAVAAPMSSVESLADYVWSDTSRPVAYADDDLIARLEEEVRSILATGHLAPFFVERGFKTREGIPSDSSHPEDGSNSFRPGNVYWFDPGELIYTLSLAYPYVSNDLRFQLHTYLRNEMQRYPPLKPLPCPMETTWFVDGTRRESYEVTVVPGVWPPPAPPLSTLYALWVYADATGDWSYLSAHWAEIRALFNEKKDEVDSYAAISGAIGYARSASHLGHTAEAQEGQDVAVAAMSAGQDFAAFVEMANTRHPDPRGQTTGLRAPVFFGLVPEVGRYLRDTNGDAVAAYLDTLTDPYHGQFLWYLTRLGLQKEIGETSFHGPELAWSVFLTKAYVQELGQPELEGYLDRPWGLGDLYYLQKLVATIEAGGVPELRASAKAVNNSTPASGDTITYTVSLRNRGTPLTSTVLLTDVIPPGLDCVPESVSVSQGSVDYADGAIRWSGVLSPTPTVILTYAVIVEEAEAPRAIVNTATIDAGEYGLFTRTSTIIVDALRSYLPVVFR